MPSGDVETYWENGQWHIKIEGTGESFRSSDTRAEAVEVGRHWAQHLKVEHIIKRQDGTVAERNSYGNDSRAST